MSSSTFNLSQQMLQQKKSGFYQLQSLYAGATDADTVMTDEKFRIQKEEGMRNFYFISFKANRIKEIFDFYLNKNPKFFIDYLKNDLMPVNTLDLLVTLFPEYADKISDLVCENLLSHLIKAPAELKTLIEILPSNKEVRNKLAVWLLHNNDMLMKLKKESFWLNTFIELLPEHKTGINEKVTSLEQSQSNNNILFSKLNENVLSESEKEQAISMFNMYAIALSKLNLNSLGYEENAEEEKNEFVSSILKKSN